MQESTLAKGLHDCSQSCVVGGGSRKQTVSYSGQEPVNDISKSNKTLVGYYELNNTFLLCIKALTLAEGLHDRSQWCAVGGRSRAREAANDISK